MLSFKSLKNIGSSDVSRFTIASFARSSTCSLPGMPIWPGTQQKKIQSYYYYFFITGVLCGLNTESQSTAVAKTMS